MMNELGMGVVVSMKDMFTQNAHRIQSSMMSLDGTVAASSANMQRNMQLLQRGTMMMGAGLALLAVPAVVVTSTLKTQKALGEMASLGVKDLASLSTAAEEFSNTWGGTSKAEFVAAAYDIKSGISSLTDVAVGEYTKLAALTAKATKSTVAEMTSLFATGYGIYRQMYARMSDFEFGKMFSGGMAASVQAFKTTGSGMASAISSLGATATTAKIPLEEQLAIIGMLQATMSGAEAGTKYRAFMKSAAQAGKELNIEFVDQNNNLLGMTAILKKLKARYGETLDAMEKMEIQKAFGRAEAVAVVDLFYTKIGDLTGNIRQMNVAMRQGTRLTIEMAQAMNMDIGSQLALVAQQMHNLFEIMGELLLPVVNPLMRGLSYVIGALQRAAKAAPGLTRAVLVLSAALGSALVAVGGMMAAAGMVGLMLPAIKAGLIAIGGALAAVGSAVAAYILPAIAIIAGVVVAVYLLRKAWQTNFAGIRDVVMGAYTRIKLVFQGIWQLISSLSSGTSRISAELASKLKAMGLWGFVKTVFMVFHRAREYVLGYVTAIISAFKKVARILEPPIRALLSAYGALYKAIFSVVEIFGIAGTAADGSTFRSLGQTIGTVLGVIAQVAAYVLKCVIYPLSWTIRIVALVVRSVIWLVKSIVQGVIYAGKFLYKFALPFRMLIQAIVAVAKVAYTLWQVLTGDISMIDGLKKIGGAIFHFLGTPFRWTRDVAAGAWNFIKGLFSGAVGFFKWAGGLIVSAILNLPIVKTLVGIWRNVRAFFSGDKTFFEAGKGILLAIGKGIWSAITLPYTLIKKALFGIRRLLPFSDAQEGPLSTLTASGRAIITTICKGILGVASLPLKIISGVFRGALRIAGAVWSGIKGVVSQGWGLVKGVSKAAAGILTAPFRAGFSVAKGIWAGMKDVVASGWNAAKEISDSVAPRIEPNVITPSPPTLAAITATVQPQLDTGGILSKLPLIGGLLQRAQPMLSSLGAKLLDGLSGTWDRYTAFWRMMRTGALNTATALRQAADIALPGVLAATLSLAPTLASAVPQAIAETGVTNAMAQAAPAMPALVPQMMRLPETVASATPTSVLDVGPMSTVATSVEKPTPMVVKEREVERTRMLAERVTTVVPAETRLTGLAPQGSPMSALLSKLDALADRPMDVNITVVSKLDGRIIAQAVYKDIRRQKVKNYETL